MIAPGVNMDRLQKPQERRERTGIVQIVLIAAVLLAALYGGLRLLGSTRVAWDARNAERKAHAEAIRTASERAQKAEHDRMQLERLTAIRAERRKQEDAMREGRLRCINGQLFQRLDNGWANLPGQRCQ